MLKRMRGLSRRDISRRAERKACDHVSSRRSIPVEPTPADRLCRSAAAPSFQNRESCSGAPHPTSPDLQQAGLARWLVDRAMDMIRDRFGWKAVALGLSRSVPAFRELAEKDLSHCGKTLAHGGCLS